MTPPRKPLPQNNRGLSDAVLDMKLSQAHKHGVWSMSQDSEIACAILQELQREMNSAATTRELLAVLQRHVEKTRTRSENPDPATRGGSAEYWNRQAQALEQLKAAIAKCLSEMHAHEQR